MLTFAYDGSLNGDWVAHYAIRFALNSAERRLRLVHILDATPAALLTERLERIADECRILGVALETELHEAAGKSVSERLLDVVSDGSETLLVTGTRARPRNLAFFAGTVSARLFAANRFPIVALRVVHPGVLGQPRRVLLPVMEPLAVSDAVPWLRLFGSELRQLHVVFVHKLSRPRFRMLGSAAADHLLHEGRSAAVAIEEELRAKLDLAACVLDASAVITDDWPKEILITAGKQKSRLVCLRASPRGLPGRLAYGNAIEQILRDAPCDVAVYRGAD